MKVVLFTIGSFNVYSFGFFLALSFLLSTFVVFKYAREKFKEEEYLDAFLYTAGAALISARLFYVFLHPQDFNFNPLRFILVRETPGLSLLGGFFGAFFFLFWYARRKKYDFIFLLDLFSLAGSVFLIFAKIGEQLGGAGFGKETNSFLGVRIAGLPGRRQPVEFYEAFFFLFLSFFLFRIYRKIQKEKWPPGFVFCLFAFFSALAIFLLEFLKIESLYLYQFSVQQWGALLIMLIMAKPIIWRIQLIRGLKKEKR